MSAQGNALGSHIPDLQALKGRNKNAENLS